jgi:hypothetical protein
MAYITPLFPAGIRYGLGTASADVQAAHAAKLTGNDTLAHGDSTSPVVGLFIKDAESGKMPAVYCCGGVYETDVFTGTIAAGDLLTVGSDGKLKTSAAPETDQLVGLALSVVSGVLRFKLFV